MSVIPSNMTVYVNAWLGSLPCRADRQRTTATARCMHVRSTPYTFLKGQSMVRKIMCDNV